MGCSHKGKYIHKNLEVKEGGERLLEEDILGTYNISLHKKKCGDLQVDWHKCQWGISCFKWKFIYLGCAVNSEANAMLCKLANEIGLQQKCAIIDYSTIDAANLT